MLRTIHSLPGVFAALLVIVLAGTGAMLAISPAWERLHAGIPAAGRISVAELAGRIAPTYPVIEQVERTPSGSVIVYFSDGERSGVDLVDPLTGKRLRAYEPSSFMRAVKNLHRSFLLDTPGRVASGTGSVAMLLLALSGTLLLARRAGGWRRLVGPVSGTTGQRLHASCGRAAVLGLLLSASTGAWMSAVSLELVPEPPEAEAAYPAAIEPGVALPVQTLAALQAIDLNELRQLVYPYLDDPTGTYSVLTDQGAGFISPTTGAMISFQAHDGARTVYELVYRLHTGEGLWWLALLLGLSALAATVLAVTGVQVWWKRRRSLPHLANNVSRDAADAVILVGSESNTTWGFAQTLHDALTAAGQRVHTAPMNQLATAYPVARTLFILSNTYGDGGAPASAGRFLPALAHFGGTPAFRYCVLGFGDRQFPRFCQFAIDVDAALAARGWNALCPLELIDRQSPQEFARWGSTVGGLLGVELNLVHTPQRPRTTTLQLAERIDYGLEVQAPTTVFRFRTAARARLPRFEAGDLVGILPPGTHAPRFYSLASSSAEGVLEICVRKHPEGLCSGYLHGLRSGDCVDAFIQVNPVFRPASGNVPVILIGAGTGIGPLNGFIKHNTARHPMYLYWGGRSPESDFLYEAQLQQYLDDRRLTQLNTAFSRAADPAYVQDRIDADAVTLRELIQRGAQVLVCGGREMASAVHAAIDRIIAPLAISVPVLKAEGRYREDVY